ncbi:unnamed protein product [Cylicocyclus nassatus]|uniref:Uncharacterized protein n=1 Tax=Cylicocyclus nassatus TaxID=53992 RepID=A0AA36MB19_CYLNA|nr:unnamed protein product [Cylicocyclus nassatus]
MFDLVFVWRSFLRSYSNTLLYRIKVVCRGTASNANCKSMKLSVNLIMRTQFVKFLVYLRIVPKISNVSARKDDWGIDEHEVQKFIKARAAELNDLPLLDWWQKWKVDANPPKMIDLRSRYDFYRENEKVKSDEVIQKILSHSYDTLIRPPIVDDMGKDLPAKVDVQCYVRSMSNIDFVRMEYTLQLTFRQFWQDPRLAYTKMFPDRIIPKFLVITEPHLIWTPDTFFMNEKNAHRHTIDKLNVMIRIHSNGDVLYSERISLTLSCAMHLQKYPMDEQMCGLYLASYAYTTDDIVYRWKSEDPIQLHPLLNTSLPNFSVEPAEISTCTSTTATGEYSCIQAVFVLKRMFSYYFAQIYLPSTLLVIVSWVSFWLDRDAVPARVTLGVTTLLTMTTTAIGINSNLPAVSYIKAVDVWIGACLAFIFATVLEYAFVSYQAGLPKYSKHCGPQEHKAELEPDNRISHASSRKDSWGTSKHEMRKILKVKAAGLNELPLLNWWQKWKVGADPPKMIDLRSRLLFPALFVLFNVFYWIWYSEL